MKTLQEKTKELQEHSVMVFNYKSEDGILIYDYDLDAYGINKDGLEDNGTGRYFLPISKINDKLFADLVDQKLKSGTTYTHSYLDDEDSCIIDTIDFGKVHNFENEQCFFYDWETIFNIKAFDLEMEYCVYTDKYYMWQSYCTRFANNIYDMLSNECDEKDLEEYRLEWDKIVEECHKYDVEPQTFDEIVANYQY